MNEPITSHEDNAVEVMDFLKLMKIEKAMAMGLSTLVVELLFTWRKSILMSSLQLFLYTLSHSLG